MRKYSNYILPTIGILAFSWAITYKQEIEYPCVEKREVYPSATTNDSQTLYARLELP